jgi:hypothetical protein
MSDIDVVRRLTSELRASDEAPWPTVRSHLRGMEVDPLRSLIANWFEDGGDLDTILVVSPDRRIYKLTVRYVGGLRHRPPGDRPEAEVFDWTEISDMDRLPEASREIAAALSILGDEADLT